MKKKVILRAVHDIDRQFFREAAQRAERAAQKGNKGTVMKYISKGAMIAGGIAAAGALAVTGFMLLPKMKSTPAPGNAPPLGFSSAGLDSSDFEHAATTDQTSSAGSDTGTGTSAAFSDSQAGSVTAPAGQNSAANAAVIDGRLPLRGNTERAGPKVSFSPYTAADLPYMAGYADVSCNSDYIFDDQLRIALKPDGNGWNRITQLCEAPHDAGFDGAAKAPESVLNDCPLYRLDPPLNIVGMPGSYLVRWGWTFRSYSTLSRTHSYTVSFTDRAAKQAIEAGSGDRSLIGTLHYMGGEWFLIKQNSVEFLGKDLGSAQNRTQRNVCTPGTDITGIIAADYSSGELWVAAEQRGAGMVPSWSLMYLDKQSGEFVTAAKDLTNHGIRCSAGYVYFVQNAAEQTGTETVPRLCRIPIDNSGAQETVVAHFRCKNGLTWTVTDDSVYYYSNYLYSDQLGKYLPRAEASGMLIRCGADGSDPHEIPMTLTDSSQTAYTSADYTDIKMLWDRNSDSILLYDLAGIQPPTGTERCFNALFSVKCDTDSVTACLLPHQIG